MLERFRSRLPALALALILAAPSAVATTHSWPGSAPCAGTLQACIDGSGDGDRIEIATNGPIAEDISLYNVNRTLTAAAGYRPGFGSGHWLSITSSAIAGDLGVSVSRLAFDDGYVYVSYNGTGTATYDLRNLVLTHAVIDTQNYILVQATGGTVNATLYDNRVSGVPSSLNNGLIELDAHGGTLNANAYYNHVQSTHTTGYVDGGGIFADYAGAGSGGTLKLHGNEVRGGFDRGGIVVSEGLFSSTAISLTARAYSNVVVGDGDDGSNGISFIVNNGTIDAQAFANTVTRCTYCVIATQWSGGNASAHISGLISSNLIRGNTGLSFATAVTPSLNNDYNLINAAGNTATLGAHTIVTDAALVSDMAPRLQPGSPAIDAADTATVGLGIVFNGLPVTDADGLRRITGPTNKVDIGAYESGNTSFLHTATAANTIIGYITRIDNPATNGDPGADPFVTSNYNAGAAGGVSVSEPVGVYYCSPSNWCIFDENVSATMQPSSHFNVFAAASGSGRIRHQATAANTSGTVTAIDASGLNSLPDRIALVAQNWSVASVYNAHPVALAYDAAAASGSGRWTLVNGDSAAVPTNAGFNIYFQEPSPNAFRITAGAGNLIGGQLILAHPLLDNVACATVQVSRVITPGSSAPNVFDVFYGSDHSWRIFSYAPGGIVAGDTYDVVVDPAQTFACSDRIFANGFDP
jgi:hypothetical protein